MTGSSLQRLGLGTAQFGLDYGITNPGGRVRIDEVQVMLDRAVEAGIFYLDTAHLYGESESAVGRSLKDPHFRIVTKTPKFRNGQSPEDCLAILRAGFEESLRRLQQSAVYGLLLHDAGDLLGPYGSDIWAEMCSIKDRGLATKIGVSVYEAHEIDAVCESYQVDLVQLPYNPLDLRLIEGGQIDRLSGKGIEIHARSLFLQGLLLQDPCKIPVRFNGLANAVSEMHAFFEANGLTRLEGILSLALARTRISCFVCGVTNLGELDELIEGVIRADQVFDLPSFEPSQALDPRILNPAHWDQLK